MSEPAETFCGTCGHLDTAGVHLLPECPRYCWQPSAEEEEYMAAHHPTAMLTVGPRCNTPASCAEFGHEHPHTDDAVSTCENRQD